MGFTNTQYANTISGLVEAAESKLSNPYYKFADKKPTPTTYYKQNKKKSTLDCASQLQYAHVSNQSALKFNKIIGFYLYGLPQITLNYDVSDNGVEADAITGDAIVLPNTIEPTPGDFFAVDYIKEDVLFKVDHVTPDTLDTGATLYKIEYHLELTEASSKIEEQVVNTYQFVADYVGTEFNCFISSADYSLATSLEGLTAQLTNYFNSIFFKSRVQTYVYRYDDTWNFYDPFMIEFIRRNKIMSTDEKFFYVAHQTTPEVTFPYEYSKTFFYGLETMDKDLIANNNIATADLITDINSLFTSRIEDYYQVRYRDNMPYKTRFTVLDKDLVDAIKFNKKFPNGDKRSIYNIIVSYMNGDSGYIDDSIIEQIHKLDYSDNKTVFYLIPFYIYIIRNYINSNILSSQTME